MEYDNFSEGWYSTFLDPIPEEHSATEVALIERHLPTVEFPKLLDIACGPGRHDLILASKGYDVVGIDKNESAIEAARQRAIPRASFHVMDMRDIVQLDTTFDCAVNLWHSFGYYDDDTNAAILRDVAACLRPGGRAVFDIYNRDHLRLLPEQEKAERSGVTISTFRSWQGNRMRCEIQYDNAPADVLDWQLYTPDEFAQVASDSGFSEVIRCAWFDESIAPSAEHARMQLVFEKP